MATKVVTEAAMEYTIALSDSSSPPTKALDRRYIFTESEDGFRIEGRERTPVEVHLSPNQTFLVVSDGRDPSYLHTMNMYAYRQLLKTIVHILMQEWLPPLGKPYWSGAYLWSLNKAQHGLHYLIYPQWQRLLTLAPKQKRLVAKSVFAATFDYDRQGGETWDEIYEHPFLVKDIIQYRAAAVACHYIAQMVQPGRYDYTFNKQHTTNLLAQDWKALFSHDGKAHKSLNRTLMNLPGGINGSLLCDLPIVTQWLNRPITDRIELLTFLLFARIAPNFLIPQDIAWMAVIYVKARREEIIAALRILSKHLRRELRPRRKDLAELVDYITRYGYGGAIQPHQGNIVGLLKKAIMWSQQASSFSLF